MASKPLPTNISSPSPTSSSMFIPFGRQSRRSSLASMSSQADREALSQALDTIHTTASRTETLTTFNEFTSPPPNSSGLDGKGLAGELVQGGLSGLYSRFRGAVGIADGTREPGLGDDSTSKGSREGDGVDGVEVARPNKPLPLARSSAGVASPAPPSRQTSTGTNASLPVDSAAPYGGDTAKSSISGASSKKGTHVSKMASLTPFTRTMSATLANPTLAPVNVVAHKEGSRKSSDRSRSDSQTKPRQSAGEATPVPVDGKKREGSRVSSRGVPDLREPQVGDATEVTTTAAASSALENADPSSTAGAAGLADHLKGSSSKTESDITRTLGPNTRAPTAKKTSRRGRSSDLSHERQVQDRFPSFDAAATDTVRRSSASPRQAERSHPSDHDRQPRSATSATFPQATVHDVPSVPSTPRLQVPVRSEASISSHNSSSESGVAVGGGKPSNYDPRHGESAQDTERRLRGRIAAANARKKSADERDDRDAADAALQQIKSRILSKDFWMRDENCKECFDCGTAFSTWRRKHHCRICGQIFDAACTSLVKGERFGQPGSLRVCKRCVSIINEYQEDSEDFEESDDNVPISTTFFQSHAQQDHPAQKAAEAENGPRRITQIPDLRPLATPMMAIPATRRAGDASSRRSAVLEINGGDANSRPGSARSHRASIGSRSLTSSHRRLKSRHQHNRPIRPIREDLAPFHRNPSEDSDRAARLPAFHKDSIIDPDLAPYMSDEGSSADEQTGIFATMHGESTLSGSQENERGGLRGLLASAKKARSRGAERGTSVASTASRELDVGSVASHKTGHNPRSARKKTSSDPFGSPSHGAIHNLPSPPKANVTRMTRSASMKGAIAPAVELNAASLQHVRKLLHQLLQDSEVPNVSAWERAMMPILLQCTDDVNPDVKHGGDDIDIRHYVKIKRIPGGRPADTAYVSGVVFSKNLALKCMPRSITHPNIVIITFPIEFQRHQQHFMSLEPIIAQEKEYLRNMVSRIVALRPHVLLVQRNIAGLALQYLADANVATAYNVKPAVLEAVSRCAQTDIISSIDMLVLKQVQVGRSAGFDTKTYVHREVAAGKKSYIYISGCPADLGCTVVLRGASTDLLAKIKRITDFMIYVVYNLKLETSLMRDEFVLIPSLTESRSFSPAKGAKKAPGLIEAAARDGQSSDVKEKASVESGPDAKKAQAESDAHPKSADITNAEMLTKETKEKDSSTEQIPSTDPSTDNLPDDVPMPTLYSDMVEKFKTKILSASPFVRFMQPYLLMRAREQERRLAYLKRLRDQDSVQAARADDEKVVPLEFYLIEPSMVHETVKDASKKVIEVLHAVHDAEYDKALHNYQTQRRQWEAHIAVNMDLFDPYAHQNIVVLYTFVCTTTAIPCAGPDLLALSFYNEHDTEGEFESDCTLGQYVEELCLTVDETCLSHGCDKKMSEHHRSYVHGEARMTVFAEKSACKIRGLQDTILMWSYCKICKKETQVMPMSENTWKYSFGKYLELSFWSSDLRLRASFCPHDLHRDHLRYFGYKNVALRIHYDPIELLEIIVPRARITWKVELDLKLKNDLFTKIEERVNRFMNSVKARIDGITVDSVVPEKAEACKVEVDRLTERARAEHTALIQQLRDKYMDSKYYEIIPLNGAIRALQEKVAEWDSAFANFDSDFFPSEKDIRRLAALQLRKMFLDRDDSMSSLEEGTATPASEVEDTDPSSASGSIELTPKPTEMCPDETRDVMASVVEQDASLLSLDGAGQELEDGEKTPTPGQTDKAVPTPQEGVEGLPMTESVSHLDLAVPPAMPSAISSSTGASHQRSTSSTPPNQPATLDGGSDQPSRSVMSDVAVAKQASKLSGTTRTATLPVPVSGIPKPIERSRRERIVGAAPPLNRTQSQPSPPVRNQSRPRKTGTRLPLTADEFAKKVNESLKASLPGSAKEDERTIAEKAGVAPIRPALKSGQSLIPRSVGGKNKKDTRVSALAKHFEQLSREFERERLRERRVRAAKSRQSRATPMASSKPIVEVYRDVHEAVEEREPSDDDISGETPRRAVEEPSSTTGNTTTQTTGPNSSETSSVGAMGQEQVEREDRRAGTGASASEAEGEGHDGEQLSTEDGHIQDSTEGTSSLVSTLDSNSDLQLDLPKHERSSLMKMLTNFWAERSASGWNPLDYPLNASDHVFLDSDVIVREDEPSSLIAFALSSEDYQAKLKSIRQQDGGATSEKDFDTDDQRLEKSLLRSTGTHLKYQFQEGSAKMLCKVFYAEQFDAVRRKCGVSDRIVESLSRCVKWDSKGGKSRSVFLKTLDERLVLKSLSVVETQAFLTFAPAYFQIMSEALFHELPTVIAKMLGFYQIIIKNTLTGVEFKYDVIVMENLFYDRSPTRIFDLKGSMRGRKIQSTGEQNEVLLDENMVEFIYESPLFAREHSKKLLRASVWNDTLFLARQNVMDYSLMIAIDEVKKELVVGIIDCIRTYTWDKKLESWIKDRGFAGGGRNRPTVTSPKEYKSRFREAMARYVLQAPNCWHQFITSQIEKRPLRLTTPSTTPGATSNTTSNTNLNTPATAHSSQAASTSHLNPNTTGAPTANASFDGESKPVAAFAAAAAIATAAGGTTHGKHRDREKGRDKSRGEEKGKEKEKRRWFVNV